MKKYIILHLFLFVAVLTGCKEESLFVMKKLVDEKFVLAEGPWWDADLQIYHFIDIDGSKVCRVAGDGTDFSSFAVDGNPGTVIPTNVGNLLVAIGNQLQVFSAQGYITDTLSVSGFAVDSLRFNDGKCAPDGRFWVGTVECKTYSKPNASLYLFDKGMLTEKLGGITVSNGISWSPDGTVMYYIDSPTRTVKAFDYDVSTGAISNGRVVIETPEEWGTPDGCCIDSKGNLWVAQWGGACVGLWNPASGELLQKLAVPAVNVTAVAIGGEDLRDLVITTASVAMQPEDEKKYPDAGSVFITRIETLGILRTKWTETSKVNIEE